MARPRAKYVFIIREIMMRHSSQIGFFKPKSEQDIHITVVVLKNALKNALRNISINPRMQSDDLKMLLSAAVDELKIRDESGRRITLGMKQPVFN